MAHYVFDNFVPESGIGYLLKRCGDLVRNAAERAFEGQPLTYTQWQVLMQLRSQTEPLAITRLTEALCHDPGAMTRVLDALERRGWVHRERSQQDRRAIVLVLTAEGRAEADARLREVMEMMNHLLEPFSSEEVATLTSLLQRVKSRLEEKPCFPTEGPR